MTAHELTDEDRELVRWFAEERLGIAVCRDFCGWEWDNLRGWPGFGLAVEEAWRHKWEIDLQCTPDVDSDYVYRIRLQGVRDDHYHADPALAAYAALRDALGAK